MVRPAFMRNADPGLLVALDVDGTLLGPEQAISQAMRAAVAELGSAGAHVVVATGRAVVDAVTVAEELGLRPGHLVCSNGAVLAHVDAGGGYEVSDIISFDPAPAVRALLAGQPGLMVAVEGLDQRFKVNRAYPPEQLPGAVVAADEDELLATPASRVTVRAPDLDGSTFEEMVEGLGLTGVSYAVTHARSAWLDITPPGVTKAAGLEMLRERLGIAPEATVAVGDGGNDIPMLHWAAWGVAMGQARPEVQSAADAVTGTIEEDGATSVLRALLEE